MAIALAALVFVLLTAAISAFGYVRYVKPTRMLDQLAGSPEPSFTLAPGLPEQRVSLGARFFEAAGNLVGLSSQDRELIRRDLAAAGIRSDLAAPIFNGIRIVAGVGLFGAALLLRNHITDNPVLRIVAIAGAGAAGYFGPGLILDQMIARRREAIRLALPDVLDLMVVCSEAGCALDQSILNVSRELKTVHPALSDELSLLNLEMQAGNTRAESLRNFALRTGEEEVRKLVAIMVQTDRFGTSISDALRTQADFLRVRRRQIAEEKAGKVGVKLVFPIFFFCLPSLLIVTAGPGILQLMKNLFPMMKEFH